MYSLPASATTSVINAVGSTDKTLIEFPTGHVGLCISSMAHEKLWPEVGQPDCTKVLVTSN